MNTISKRRFVAVAAFVVAVAAAPGARAQMEKRDAYSYDPVAFAREKPALGERAPELALADLDGRPVRLDDFLGRTVLVVKGGFT
jgi:cytochrome oxidase Cu insertion factor (SCO1/SenC/PrrC family)